jgi:hypothetical protein
MTMKNVFATSALILACGLSAGSAFAGYSAPQTRLNTQATSSYFAPSAPSVLSRAEVKAELTQAQKAGNLPAMGESVNVRETAAPSTLTREAVRAEFLQAQKAGTLPAMGDRG